MFSVQGDEYALHGTGIVCRDDLDLVHKEDNNNINIKAELQDSFRLILAGLADTNNPENYLWFGDLFRLLENCFLLSFRDLAVLIFPTLLADIQRLKWKSVQGPRGWEHIVI